MKIDVVGLVERLRDRAESYRIGGPSSEHTAAILDEAATALEVQAAELAAVTASRDGYAKDAAARADECDRLRAALAEARNALNLIDALDPEEHIYGVSHDACRGLIIRMGQIARRVLTGGQEDGQ